jgi:ganglioside GM2 activator
LRSTNQIKSTVDLCTALTTYPEYICSIFPPDVPCSCPIDAGTYNAPDAFVTFDAEWLAINGGVNVSESNISFVFS